MTYRTELAGQPLDIESPVAEVSFRRFRGDADFEHMARILMATSAADGGTRFETAERVRRSYEHLYNCDPYVDMIFAEAGGRPIGYSRCMWEDKVDGTRTYGAYGWLEPEWRLRGIGSAMYEANERHLRAIAADHPAEIAKSIGTVAAEADIGAMSLFAKHGFEPDMYVAEMVRPDLENIPEAPMPEGLEVRPATEADYRRVWDAAVDAFRDHHDEPEAREEWYRNWLAEPHFDPALWRIAWDGDEVAGQVRSYIDHEENELFGRRRGWTEDISTRKPYRRRGLARSLLAQSLHAVKAAGMEEAALGVHTDNPNGAYQLYESVGFRIVHTDVFFKKAL